MAYMGSKAGEILAAYERALPLIRNAQKSIYDILGGVEVSVLINGRWRKVGTIEEQGPIASDTHILPVGYNHDFNKVKLTMTKGLWRIDQVSLCNILGEKEPFVIQPAKLLNKGIEDYGLLKTLIDPESMLVINPGTSYTLVFEIPEIENLSVFLKSQGYYTEWMRDEWLEEENPEMIQLIIKKPYEWLKLMSPKYKLIESEMESLFWSSKFGKIEY
jgi:hypothetical protein